MSSILSEFFSAWGEADQAKQSALITAVVSSQCVYSDPRSGKRLTGPGPIAQYVSQFVQHAPGWSARLVKTDEVNGFLRAVVAFGGAGPDGSPMVQHGTYFAELDQKGKIALLVGFAGLATAG